MEVETLCFGVFSAKGTGQLHHIKGMIDEAMYCQGQGIKASQDIDNWSWQWPKTHSQGNKKSASRGPGVA